MTSLEIDSGICGFSTVVRVSATPGESAAVEIESKCKQIANLAAQLHTVDGTDLFKKTINRNPVYEKAGACGLHAGCPVPCGIIKAVEAELGFALKKGASIAFQA
ncbi:hypothetical protein DENIS_3905 [Desulfonema ishimotonii]|uniref:Uncharacterized protein n=1 Tax=Desulfonema ishimotonii TaxID=45657 RepID=A0A401G137_9BACT|nr:hypothetical protein [Desulfonema ishimotonii]GBC62921.1 hypothetical protein DENIS_3905 [Desulfonema ishimotonii]